MEDTLTINLSRTSSILEAQFFPPIELSPDKHYVLGLVELLTFNTIPNIDEKNKFYVEGQKPIVIPPGSYEIDDIEKLLKKRLSNKEIEFSLKVNNNTLRSSIKCSHRVDFTYPDSIGFILGFTPRTLTVCHSSLRTSH